MNRKEERRAVLQGHIDTWTKQTCYPVPLADFSHDLVSEALRGLAYRLCEFGLGIPILYRDEKDLITLPVGRLAGRENPSKLDFSVITLGSMSLRHHELDFLCSGYLCLNSVVSGRRLTRQQTHLEAYAHAKAMLEEYVESRAKVWIQLIETGLQPAIIGIYQAVEEVLVSSPGSLVVEPFLFQDRNGESLQSDDDEEREQLLDQGQYGTRLEDYTPLKPWY